MATEDIKVPDIGDFDSVPIIEIHVAEGDTVSAEDPLITLESDKAAMDVDAPKASAPVANIPKENSVAGGAKAQGDIHAEVVVLGAGPGGYTAAFRAADLGMKVVLVERWDT